MVKIREITTFFLAAQASNFYHGPAITTLWAFQAKYKDIKSAVIEMCDQLKLCLEVVSWARPFKVKTLR